MVVPIRTCLACRRRAPKGSLLRLTVADGTVTADPMARRPGRGGYLCLTGDCLDRALHREGAAIVRALRLDRSTRVVIDRAGLTEAVERAARTQQADDDSAMTTSAHEADAPVVA